MENKVIIGASALYEYGFIEYKPSILTISMKKGTNVSNYNESISIQNLDTLYIGTKFYAEGFQIYIPERLFIELELFPLESTCYAKALQNLEEYINPQLVKDIYEKLIAKGRRGINRERIEKYIDKNVLRLIDALRENPSSHDVILREYIISLLSKSDIPASLIKGGSAVELYVNFKRATLDINTHLDKRSLDKLISILTNSTNLVYFEFINKKEVTNDIESGKKIVEMIMLPKTRKRSLSSLLLKQSGNPILIKLNINMTYSEDELIEIINDYQITKIALKHIKNGFGLVFTPEMLLAEKYQSLITKNENSTRTKDLIDLINIYNENEINFEKFTKWLFRKWSRDSRNPKTEEESLSFIKKNKDIELTKIKADFKNATLMYNTTCTYEEGIEIYNKISDKILNLK